MEIDISNDKKSETESDRISEVRTNISVKAWDCIDEMDADINSYKKDGFCPEYFEYIKKRIEATANVDPNDREKIDDVVCKLWECRSSLDIISIGQANIGHSINNKQYTLKEKAEKGDPIAKALVEANIFPEQGKQKVDKLLEMSKDKIGGFARSIYGNGNKDFTDLAIDIAFLHANMKKYNTSYNFGSVVVSILGIYECTKYEEIKSIIEEELKKIRYKNGRFGAYRNRIKDFSSSLMEILVL